jgi:hypothetical protein
MGLGWNTRVKRQRVRVINRVLVGLMKILIRLWKVFLCERFHHCKKYLIPGALALGGPHRCLLGPIPFEFANSVLMIIR